MNTGENLNLVVVLILDQRQLKTELLNYIVVQKKISWEQHKGKKRIGNTEDTERRFNMYLIEVPEEETDNGKE